jgi:hypothetical protein
MENCIVPKSTSRRKALSPSDDPAFAFINHLNILQLVNRPNTVDTPTSSTISGVIDLTTVTNSPDDVLVDDRESLYRGVVSKHSGILTKPSLPTVQRLIDLSRDFRIEVSQDQPAKAGSCEFDV